MVSPREGQRTRRLTPLLLLGACAIAVLIGLRYKVGADWDTYRAFFDWRGGRGPNAPAGEDPGYQFVNWLVQQANLDFWAVNFICGAIFTWGLIRFCVAQADPWLSVLIAVPYMVIVVAMGYTRQAVALGILMAGLAAIEKGSSTVRFSIYTAVAAFFHRTAVMALPIVALASRRNRAINLLIGLSAAIWLYDIFLGSSLDKFVNNYIHRGYSSSGAGIRLAMNFVAAMILVMANRRLRFTENEWRLWRNFSVASVVLLILLFLTPSSTAIDRMSIYVMPLQIAVLSRVPLAFGSPVMGRLLVILYLAAVQFTWLNFAQHAQYWVPYRFYPF